LSIACMQRWSGTKNNRVLRQALSEAEVGWTEKT